MLKYYGKPTVYKNELCYLVHNVETKRYEVVCPWVLRNIADFPDSPEGLDAGKIEVDKFVAWVHSSFGGAK